jgi:hypothetical protein
VPITTYIAGMGASWQWMAGQLLVSALASLSVCQDLGLRIRLGAVFWFLIALAFGISALVTAIRSNLRFAPAICVVLLCSETLLSLWWILRSRSKRNS